MFGIDVETCIHCGGQVKIVTSVEEPQAIHAILDHFQKHGVLEQAHNLVRPMPTRQSGRKWRLYFLYAS